MTLLKGMSMGTVTNMMLKHHITTQGRVFLGGSDGHLYELQYAAADSWGRKRCQKVWFARCMTPGGS